MTTRPFIGALAALAVSIPVASASAPHKPADPPVYVINQFIGLGFEFDAHNQWIGADVLGRTRNGFLCGRNNAEIVTYSREHGFVPPGHMLGTTCVHVEFKAPLPRGYVIVQPYRGPVAGYFSFTVQFSPTGHFIGAKKLGKATTKGTCASRGADTLNSSYASRIVPKGVSVLIYCVPVPMPSAQRIKGNSI